MDGVCLVGYEWVLQQDGNNFCFLQIRMVRWMCGIKLKDRLPSKELRERLGVDDIALVLQQNRLRWYGHVLRKEDDWVKKCVEYEVEGPRPRGRPKRTWREVVKEDCQAHKLNTEDAMNRSKWRKLIKDVRSPGWVLVCECFFWYQPTRVVPDQQPLNGCVLCVFLQICLKFYEHEFMELACQCPAVVVCRCSPTQKAEIVKLIKVHTGVRTLAIGI